MAFIFTILLSFFGIFAGLGASNLQGVQERGRDTVRKNDINSIFQKLEEHYNKEGDYPTTKQLEQDGADNFPGLDIEALFDENGTAIWESGSEYTYKPAQCGATGCQKYELSALLEDKSIYSKKSLN